MPHRCVHVAMSVAACALPSASLAQTSQVLASAPLTSGLIRPCWVGGAPGDDTRLFVIERFTGTSPTAAGRVRVLNNLWTAPALNGTPFFTSPAVATGGEQGLLGMAFHPAYAQNGMFYFFYTRQSDSAMVVARGQRSANPDVASAVAEPVLVIPDTADNHNGGWMEFGPDGNLYVAIGDGGGSNDDQPPSGSTIGNAQDITSNLKGKILRLDVDGPDNVPATTDDDAFPADPDRNYTVPPDNPFLGITGDDEIWLYGLRNPWRNNFDSLSGELWIADVGQGAREEISVVAPYASGLNLGWRCYEGTRVTGLGGCSPLPAPVLAPIAEYVHTGTTLPPFNSSGCSITGGVVYRGSALPCFRGRYIFADYCSGDIFSFRRTSAGALTEVVARRIELDPPGTPSISNITSFGADTRGEIYIVDNSGGEVFRIIPNGYSGNTTDANGNGVPDACEGAACDTVDVNRDQLYPDTADIDAFLAVFSGGACPTPFCGDTDFNNDGLYPDTADVDSLLSVFSGGPCL